MSQGAQGAFTGQATLASVKVRPYTLWFQQGYSIAATNLNGEMDGQAEHGLFERNTRYLSRYIWKVDHQSLGMRVVQPVTHNSMFGYYRANSPNPAVQKGLDIQIARIIGQGMHEDIVILNNLNEPLQFQLSLECEADFADIMEVVQQQRQQLGRLEREWDEIAQKLTIRYTVEDVQHGLELSFNPNMQAVPQDNALLWNLELAPRGQCYLCVDAAPIFCNEILPPLYGCYEFFPDKSRIRMENRWLADSTRLSCGNLIVQRAYDTAKSDLVNMRLWEEDQGPDQWIPAAGLPIYTGVFGRDILTTGWQAGLIGPEIMKGSVAVLNKYQADQTDDWRDAQPGKMLHEARLGPLSLLDKIPQRYYYGSATTTPLYFIVLSELFHWTGDMKLLEDSKPHMDRALAWIEQHGDLDGDGFYEYQTRSSQGGKNQGWKDSADAIVYADGRQVETPIATCEEQAWVYEAKIRASILYAALREFDTADRLIHEAHQLKEQFNRKFWMADEGFYALALDPQKNPVASITSNPGHCLAAGIVDEDKAGMVIGRMLSPDLFSGWGIRTLSSRHPSYDPYGYHLGTVWPVENGTFCMAFVRYGYPQHANLLAEAIFNTSRFFEYGRLPEAISGHPKDAEHPIPSVYPQSNMPQAWSCSAVPIMLQAILGLYPFAPLNLLLLDPHLPEWLPEITLQHLRVGNARLSLHFWRDESGTTHHRILDRQGTIRIAPHLFNIHKFHQLKDFSEAFLSKR